MDLLSITLIAIALAMDAFAVSLCKGLEMGNPRFRDMFIVGIWFGVFQAVMPIIGYLLGDSMYDLISDYDHWIAFGLLAIIGANMIRESFSDEDEAGAGLGFRIMLVLAIATSIDAFAVGITLAMDGSDIVIDAVMIGLITLFISMLGVGLGSQVGKLIGRKAEVLGGIILILIGFKILLEHLGFL